jgi:hypothetical protein
VEEVIPMGGEMARATGANYCLTRLARLPPPQPKNDSSLDRVV